MLNSDGEIEEGEVNYAEQHSEIVSPTQVCSSLIRISLERYKYTEGLMSA